jgi:hypothetical protein
MAPFEGAIAWEPWHARQDRCCLTSERKRDPACSAPQSFDFAQGKADQLLLPCPVLRRAMRGERRGTVQHRFYIPPQTTPGLGPPRALDARGYSFSTLMPMKKLKSTQLAFTCRSSGGGRIEQSHPRERVTPFRTILLYPTASPSLCELSCGLVCVLTPPLPAFSLPVSGRRSDA